MQPWLILAGLIALSTALHGFAGSKVRGPWISPDETVYALLGQGLYRHGSLAILGGPTPFYSLTVPLLVGPFLSLHDLELGYALLKPFLAFVMSLAAVPVYFWARSVAGRREALLAAALTLAVPGLAYSGLVMSEVVFYPVFTLAAWTAARAIAVPSWARAAVLAAAVTLAALTRLQALVLLPAIVLAVVLDAIFARSRTRLVRSVPVLVAALLPVAAGLLVQVASGRAGVRRVRERGRRDVQHGRRGPVHPVPRGRARADDRRDSRCARCLRSARTQRCAAKRTLRDARRSRRRSP